MQFSLLIKDLKAIVTMNSNKDILPDHHLLIENGRISSFLPQGAPLPGVDSILDGKGCFLYPGLINTHHHLFQVLTRNIGAIQEKPLFPWLSYLYPIWARITPEMAYTAALVGMGELMKGGVTTTVDHHYLFPQGMGNSFIDVEIEAAKRLGIRMAPCRGSMSLSQEEGGLPPKEVVQKEEEILKDSRRLIETYHDPSPSSKCRIILAPCSPFSVTKELMVETIQLARSYGVICHTHLAETLDEVEYCLDRFNKRPLAYMEELGWLGEDIFFAHGIHFTREELKILAQTSTGISHSPISNQKLASGRALLEEMLDLGIRVGLGVDGSASNDASNMILEMKSAFHLHRQALGMNSPGAYQILSLATTGGASLLGQTAIGSLEVGKEADLFLFRVDGLDFAGGMEDPVWSLINCGLSQLAEYTLVGGEVVVEKGRLTSIDEEKTASLAREFSSKLLKGV